MIVFVDVDDTLVRSFGSKRMPMSHVVDHVRRLHAEGVTIYLWSTAGETYAASTASELGIAECVKGYLPKPNVMIDDQDPSQWRRLIVVHPNETSGKTKTDYEAAICDKI